MGKAGKPNFFFLLLLLWTLWVVEGTTATLHVVSIVGTYRDETYNCCCCTMEHLPRCWVKPSHMPLKLMTNYFWYREKMPMCFCFVSPPKIWRCFHCGRPAENNKTFSRLDVRRRLSVCLFYKTKSEERRNAMILSSVYEERAPVRVSPPCWARVVQILTFKIRTSPLLLTVPYIPCLLYTSDAADE